MLVGDGYWTPRHPVCFPAPLVFVCLFCLFVVVCFTGAFVPRGACMRLSSSICSISFPPVGSYSFHNSAMHWFMHWFIIFVKSTKRQIIHYWIQKGSGMEWMLHSFIQSLTSSVIHSHPSKTFDPRFSYPRLPWNTLKAPFYLRKGLLWRSKSVTPGRAMTFDLCWGQRKNFSS